LRDADIVTDHTNVAELLLIILPAHYCSSLASAFAQQQVVGASESIERKAVLLEEAGGMPLQQTDALPEKKNHNGNVPDEEEHTQHTEAKVFKILDDATRDAFERLLDTELLFAEFQQVRTVFQQPSTALDVACVCCVTLQSLVRAAYSDACH